ncbi:MAG TPA: hypothetical protein VHZ73_09050 [Vicinamibacterales bacterium]|nr:hypothetical protein [Vicinamibacterales bacterium]
MDEHGRSSFRQVQAQLSAAKVKLKAGEFDAALERIDRALQIDPNYLAAHALRDKVTAAKLAPAPSQPDGPAPTPIAIDNFSKLEERARRRRTERRLQTAREAIRAGQLGVARAAVVELVELDPDYPHLTRLSDELARAEGAAQAMPNRDPWVAAGVIFAALLLAVGGVETSAIRSGAPRLPIAQVKPLEGRASLIDTPQWTPLDVVVEPAFERHVDTTLAPATDVRPASTPIAPIDVTVPPPAMVEPRPAAPPVTPLQPADISQQPITKVIFSDERLVRDTLQRYRSAYEGLNAKSAQDVWPTVDEPALARAFEGLESQSLTFEDCAIQLHGVLATATCRGSARYTPRTGSRESHVEPRVWNFALSRLNAVWQIDSARVDR